jgi:hypothetical protein
MQESEENSNEFLNELRLQFERDLDIRKTLDSKATSTITMSGTIVTILIGIGTFLVTRLDPTSQVYGTSLIIFAIGVISAITCIGFVITSYMLKKYIYPMGHEQFFINGEYNTEMSDKFRKAPRDQFTKRMIQEYLTSIKNFSKVNADKAILIKIGQVLFLGCIALTAILLGYILSNMNLLRL